MSVKISLPSLESIADNIYTLATNVWSLLQIVANDVTNIVADTTDIVVDIASVQTDTTAIQVDTTTLIALLNALLTLSETGGTLTATALEQNVVIDNAPTAVYKPLKLKINLDAMDADDTIVIKWYERISSAGNLELSAAAVTYIGVDGGLIGGMKQITLDLDPNRYGFKVTLQQTAQVSGFKNFPYEYFYEA